MNKKLIIILSSLIGIIFFSLIYFFYDREIYFNLKGRNIVNISINDEYEEDGFTALYCTKHFKLFCKNIKKNVKIIKNDKKDFYKTYFNYILKYKGKEKILVREINYKDLDSPTIKLIGNNTSICPNDDYLEEGYIATDNVDGDITDKVVISKIDNKIYYSVSDNAGNKKIVYRTLEYKDDISPTINLFGGETIYLYINQNYNEKGYTATDNCDGDITKKVNINSNLDNTKTGEYNIEYSVLDNSGNKFIINRKVIVYDDLSSIPKNGKVVYLTFDDGPCVYTEDIINVLNKYNVKATFFVTNQFSGYNDMIKKEYDYGHSIAVHTYSHNYNLIYSSLDSYLDDFNKMNEIIKEQTGSYSKIFRFPGGSSNTISKFNRGIVTDIANKMNESGYIYFDWNVDSNDTGTADPNQIFKNVINGIENNESSVVLMHDIKRANIDSVDKIIKYGLENGYTFLPLDESSPLIQHTISN